MIDLTPKEIRITPARDKIVISVRELQLGEVIAGLSMGSDSLTKGQIKILGTDERILFGLATEPLTGVGIFMGKDDTDYEFRVGDPSGQFIHWDGSTLTIKGVLTASEVHIPDQDSTANSFHVDSDGNAWWGATETDFIADNDNAPAYILKDGTAKFQNVTVEGAIVAGAGSQIPNLYTFDEYTAGENITAGEAVYELYIQEFDNFDPDDTNYVDEVIPGSAFNNTVSMFVGGATGTDKRLGFIQFDISSLPSGDAEEVILNVKIRNEPGGGKSNTFTISRVEASWTPSTLTWTNKPAFSGNFGTFQVSSGDTGWKTVDITTLYNAWKDSTYSNFGIAISATDGIGDQWDFWGGAGVDNPYFKVTAKLDPGDADIGKVYKGLADVGTRCGTFRGIATETITAGNTIRIQTGGRMPVSDLVVSPGNGAVYVSDSNAGQLVNVAPTFPMAVGKVIGANFFIRPQFYIRDTFTGKYITGFQPLAVYPTDITLGSMPTITYKDGSVEVDANTEYIVMGI